MLKFSNNIDTNNNNNDNEDDVDDYDDIDIVVDDENDNGDDDDTNDNDDINKFTMPRSPIKCFILCSLMMYDDGNYSMNVIFQRNINLSASPIQSPIVLRNHEYLNCFGILQICQK